MISAYENLIASCISACIRGDGYEAERICLVDLPTTVDLEYRRGTEDAVSEGMEAEKRMKEVIDSFFPE